jgi:hypothetical protein
MGGLFCPETGLSVFELKFIADYFRTIRLDFKGKIALIKNKTEENAFFTCGIPVLFFIIIKPC